jgi:hypothetical protein
MRSFLFLLGLGFALLGCSLPLSVELHGTPSLESPEAQPNATLPLDVPTVTVSRNTDTPVITQTPVVTPFPEIINAQRFGVVFLSEDIGLDVQTSPGYDQQVITRMGPHSTGITHTHQFQWLNGILWLEINVPGGGTGWVKADNLTPQIDSRVFCLDSRMDSFINQFAAAIKERDGVKFMKLISPLHGLTVQHEWWNPEVRFPAGEKLAGIFTDSSSYDWGMQGGSGLPIQGSFYEVIVPLLDEVLAQYSSHCNTLEQGVAASGSGGFTEWPFEYANFNYYTLYHPASATDALDWRTWALGLEFLGDQPYLVVLVHYHWEI